MQPQVLVKPLFKRRDQRFDPDLRNTTERYRAACFKAIRLEQKQLRKPRTGLYYVLHFTHTDDIIYKLAHVV